MLKNNIKIAWRNLLRNKLFSLINIFGLALGLAICLLIALFVSDELGYDKHHWNADRIFRVNTNIHLNGSDFTDRVTPAPMAAALEKDFPQIEKAVRINGGGSILVKKGNETLIEHDAFGADAGLFDVFTLPMISGNPKTALSQPGSLVISASVARKYFGSTDVIGKTLIVENTTPLKITGVIADMPAQSHLHFRFIRTLLDSEDAVKSNFWLNNNYATYLLVRAGTTQQTINTYLKQTAAKYVEPQLQNFFHSSFSDLEKKGDYFVYSSIPLKDIHLRSPLSSELEPSGNLQYVYIFLITGVFILAIACVNFMNLSTARSAGRSKEVGVRKVMGSNRGNLIRQFLTESVLTSFIAMLLALLLAALLLPLFNQISGKEISVYHVSSLRILPVLALATVLVGLIAGSYPAFFLSAFEPVQVLKGKLASGFKGSWLRNSLVVFQFSTAIILIIGTLVIYSQLSYIRNKNLGYNREQVLVLKNAYALGEHAGTFKEEVLQIPGVISGSRLGSLPTSGSRDWNTNAFSKSTSLAASETLTLADWAVDTDYITTMGMQIAAGRNFSALMPTDSGAILLNETAARMLGFRKPLGEKLYESLSNEDSEHVNAHPVIGIVKDFNAGSMRYKTQPIVFRLSKYGDRFAFRLKGNNLSAIIQQIETKYHAVEKMDGQPFLYSFLDEDFNKLYSAEQRTGKIFMSFAFFAILIACLGLFGLVTYAAEQRTKEIGVRKVLGATVQNIVTLLSADFLKLVGIAALIA
ncbi:MAG: ABC transporter permease, partial [Mucilaginibacter polytrichastri]|nr:ABC transporter permease [Mucilaginibacter polytrichastri]